MKSFEYVWKEVAYTSTSLFSTLPGPEFLRGSKSWFSHYYKLIHLVPSFWFVLNLPPSIFLVLHWPTQICTFLTLLSYTLWYRLANSRNWSIAIFLQEEFWRKFLFKVIFSIFQCPGKSCHWQSHLSIENLIISEKLSAIVLFSRDFLWVLLFRNILNTSGKKFCVLFTKSTDISSLQIIVQFIFSSFKAFVIGINSF